MMIKDLEMYKDLTSNESAAVLGGNSTFPVCEGTGAPPVYKGPYFPRLPFPLDPTSPGSPLSIPGLKIVPPVYYGLLPGAAT